MVLNVQMTFYLCLTARFCASTFRRNLSCCVLVWILTWTTAERPECLNMLNLTPHPHPGCFYQQTWITAVKTTGYSCLNYLQQWLDKKGQPSWGPNGPSLKLKPIIRSQTLETKLNLFKHQNHHWSSGKVTNWRSLICAKALGNSTQLRIKHKS